MISTVLSNGHTADIKMVEQLVVGLKAKLYADRRYISYNLKQSPKKQGIGLITYHPKDMQAKAYQLNAVQHRPYGTPE